MDPTAAQATTWAAFAPPAQAAHLRTPTRLRRRPSHHLGRLRTGPPPGARRRPPSRLHARWRDCAEVGIAEADRDVVPTTADRHGAEGELVRDAVSLV
ncbi:hypothetical protein GCM10023259_001270 [Thermocatellispora tengchongensis]